MDEPAEVVTSPPEIPPEVPESPRLAARRDPQWVIDGCKEARVLIEWAAEMGFKAADQEFAPILFCGIYTQDSRLLHSLGGFDRKLAAVVRKRALEAKIWCGPGKIGNNWFDEATGEWTFMLDLMVVCKHIRRINRKGQEPLYARNQWSTR